MQPGKSIFKCGGSAKKELPRGKIVVVNEIPECLRVYTSKKVELLKEFNACINSILTAERPTNPVVFTFSREKTPNFLARIFSKTFLESESTKVIQ